MLGVALLRLRSSRPSRLVLLATRLVRAAANLSGSRTGVLPLGKMSDGEGPASPVAAPSRGAPSMMGALTPTPAVGGEPAAPRGGGPAAPRGGGPAAPIGGGPAAPNVGDGGAVFGNAWSAPR